jgi:hypothetical protein
VALTIARQSDWIEQINDCFERICELFAKDAPKNDPGAKAEASMKDIRVALRLGGDFALHSLQTGSLHAAQQTGCRELATRCSRNSFA